MQRYTMVTNRMRWTATILLMLVGTVPWMTGCSALRMFGLNESVVVAAKQSSTQPEIAFVSDRKSNIPSQGVESNITQVTHFDSTICQEDSVVDEACVPTTLSPGSCLNHSCTGCQSCNVPPNGYEPISPYYFNPYLIDPNEFICDGGDNAPKARAKAGDMIVGVDLEDTVVRYTTDAGDVHVQPSNKVCLYAPRFAAVRRVVGAESGELAVGAIGVERPQGPIRVQLNEPGLAVTGRDDLGRGTAVRGPDAMRARDRSVPVEVVLQPEVAEDVLAILANLSYLNQGILRDTDKPWISKAAIAAITWSIDEEVAVTVNSVAPVTLIRDQSVEEMVVYDFPDAGRLRICKMADKSNALPGDIVTFMIRVDNVGDSAVHDIVITDNLVTRLEYVTDSETCTTNAEFETEANDGQSLRLTWKLTKELKVGEGATIEFKCKVR